MNNSKTLKISVLGDGAWGTTLAMLLAGKGHEVRIWGAFEDYIKELNEKRENTKFLPGIAIPESIALTSDLGRALDGADLLVMAVPSRVVRQVSERVAAEISGKCPDIVNVSKGVENGTLLRMSETIGSAIKGVRVCTLSGPSHAEEVARNVPTAVVAASASPGLAERVQDIFTTPTFRVYSHGDIAGVELGGTIKNIIAIATGICDGLGLGDNTKAALMARGLHEMSRLGLAVGADALTFSGLSGLGDLIATCMSRHSRNRWFGEEIGRGGRPEDVLKKTEKVVEGYTSALSIEQLCRKTGVEMPIAHKVYDILYEGGNAQEAVTELMARSLKPEISFAPQTRQQEKGREEK